MQKDMKNIIAAIVASSIVVSGCSMFVPKTQTVNAVCSEFDASYLRYSLIPSAA